jgi:hypothetical protein
MAVFGPDFEVVVIGRNSLGGVQNAIKVARKLKP